MPGLEHEMEDADQAVRSTLDAVPDEKWQVLVQLVDELTASGVSRPGGPSPNRGSRSGRESSR